MKTTVFSFEVLAAMIAATILQACAGTTTTTQCAKPTLSPPGRKRSGAFRHGQDSDGDNGGLFVLHARPFYTDWGTIRSRHENTSVERESHVQYRAQDVKSHCVQGGMNHFADRSRRIRLRARW